MREIKSEQIKKIVKKAKTNLVIWTVVAICSMAILALSFFMNDFRKGAVFNEVLDNDPKENKFVEASVNLQPIVFAHYPTDNSGKFYFMWDDKYIYIAFLSEKALKEYDVEDIAENPKVLKGITKKIPSDIKKLALKSYNEFVDEDKQISSADFETYFGTLYIDETEVDPLQVGLMLVGIIGWFVGFVMVLALVIGYFRLKKQIKKMDDNVWEEINKELEEEESFYYKNAKLALTKHYIVDFSIGLKVIKYSDILWMYRYELRQNGIKSQMSIMLYLNSDKKRHVIAALPGYTKKSKEVNREIMDAIMNKNKKMLVGYTKENRDIMKEEYQIKA